MLPVVGGAARWNPRPVTGRDEPRRLALEVSFDARPIRGRLLEEDGARRLDRPFSGWLGLMAAIEAARGMTPVPEREEDPR